MHRNAGTTERPRISAIALAAALCLALMGAAFALQSQAPATALADEEVSVALDASKSYSDVSSSAWYAQWVKYVTQNNLMTGYSGTSQFGPNDTLTREQAATILFRYANPGSNATTTNYGNETSFYDVYLLTYSTAAIEWCYETGVVTGYTDSNGNWTGRFGPTDSVTREQMATILYRYASTFSTVSNTSTSAVSKIADFKNVSGYAKTAVAWCYNNGIMTGHSDTGLLDPQGTLTRAQMAKMIAVVSQKGI